MMVGGQGYQTVGRGRPWTFYALAALFGLFLLFLYGPMLVIYILSFQGPDGGVTFPMGRCAMFAVVNRVNRAYEEAANDLGATAWQRLRHVTLPILLPGIIGVAMGAFTLSYDEYARTTLVIGERNTLPLEIYALISSATSPTLFAIGTITTGVSFLVIGLTLWRILRLQRRRAGAMPS